MHDIFTYEYFRFTIDTSQVHISGIKQWLPLDTHATILAGKVAMCFDRLSKHHITVNAPDTNESYIDLIVVLKCLLVRMADDNRDGTDTVVTMCRNIRQNCGEVAFIGLMNAYVVKLLNDHAFDENRCNTLLHIAWMWLRNTYIRSPCAIPANPLMLESDAKSSNHLLSFLFTRYTNEANLRTHIENQCVHLCSRVLNRTYVGQPSGPVFNVTKISEHTTVCAQAIQDALQDYSVVHQHMWEWLRSTRNIEWFNLESNRMQSKQSYHSKHADGALHGTKCHSLQASHVFWLKSLSGIDNEFVYRSAMFGQSETTSQTALGLLHQLVGYKEGGGVGGRNDTEFKSDWKRICDGECLSGVGNPNITRNPTHMGPRVSDIVTVLSPEWRMSCASVHASTLFLLGLNLLRVSVSLISKFDATQMANRDSSQTHSLLQACFQHAYEATLCMCAVQHTQEYTLDAPFHGLADGRGVVSQLAYVCVLFVQEVMYKMKALQVPFVFAKSLYTYNVFRVAKIDADHGLPAYLLRRFDDTFKSEKKLDISAYNCLRPSSTGS
jgi:hypothetical protein